MCKGTTFFRDIQDFNDFLYSHYCILKKCSFLIAKIANKACVFLLIDFMFIYKKDTSQIMNIKGKNTELFIKNTKSFAYHRIFLYLCTQNRARKENSHALST